MSQFCLWMPSRCGLVSLISGIAFMVKSLLCLIFYSHIETSVELLMDKELALTPDTHMLRLWSNPPLTPRLKVYIFNVTNPDEILAGQMPRVHEVGPYVYSAYQTKSVSGWSDSGNIITFRSRTLYKFLPEESPLSDQDFVILPNMIMMTGMMKPEVQEQLSFIKKQMVWPLLMSDGHKTPFINVSVAEFLWGYEDELACLAESDLTQSSQDQNLDWDEEDPFQEGKSETKSTTPDRVKFVKRRNYRRADGKCMFGVFADKNYTWDGSVSMMSGKTCLTEKGKIVDIDKSTDFEIWQPESKCDKIAGAREPSATPPVQSSSSNFELLIGIMCRKVNLVHTSNINYTDSITTKRFTPVSTSFDVSDPRLGKSCYNKGQSPKLPSGSLGVQSCAEGSPIAVSFPHFLHGDQWYLDQIEGVSPPDPQQHEMYLDLEPRLGAPVGIQIRFQLNLLLQKDPDFPPLANLQKNLTVLPIFWAQEGYDLPPPRALFEMELALNAPTIISSGLTIVFFVLGSILILTPTFFCLRDKLRARNGKISLIQQPHSLITLSAYVKVPQHDKILKEPI